MFSVSISKFNYTAYLSDGGTFGFIFQVEGFTGNKTLTPSSLIGGGGEITTAGSSTIISEHTNIASFFAQPWPHYFIGCAIYINTLLQYSNCIIHATFYSYRRL